MTNQTSIIIWSAAFAVFGVVGCIADKEVSLHSQMIKSSASADGSTFVVAYTPDASVYLFIAQLRNDSLPLSRNDFIGRAFEKMENEKLELKETELANNALAYVYDPSKSEFSKVMVNQSTLRELLSEVKSDHPSFKKISGIYHADLIKKSSEEDSK